MLENKVAQIGLISRVRNSRSVARLGCEQNASIQG